MSISRLFWKTYIYLYRSSNKCYSVNFWILKYIQTNRPGGASFGPGGAGNTGNGPFPFSVYIGGGPVDIVLKRKLLSMNGCYICCHKYFPTVLLYIDLTTWITCMIQVYVFNPVRQPYLFIRHWINKGLIRYGYFRKSINSSSDKYNMYN